MSGLSAIIVAAGASTRMGGIDKVWSQVAGMPLLAYSVAALAAVAGRVSVVVRTHDLERTRALLSGSVRDADWDVVSGGPRRQDSVRNGLEAMPDAGFVAVHDAARALVTPELVERVWEGSRETGAAICALPVVDTLWRVRGEHLASTVDRADLWGAQTPQIFDVALLRAAHAIAERESVDVTDDAMLVRRCGGVVRAVPGDPWNFKITVAEDLERARILLSARGRPRGWG